MTAVRRATGDVPLVSVVMIFLNAEAFIDEAIASVHAQSWPDWELLLVDDGSSDGSTAIAREWSRRDPGRTRYLEHPGHGNRGMSASRNLGFREARGEFVALLDADDVWVPEKLEAQLGVMRAHPRAAMTYGRSEIWWSWTGAPEDRSRDHVLDLGVTPDTLVEPPTLVRILIENRAQTPTTCNVLLRRDAIERVGGFHDGFRGIFDDHVFFAKLGLEMPVFVSGARWARYRQHAASACATAARDGSDRVARLRFMRWLRGYLDEKRVADPTLRTTLDREIWSLEHPRLAGASRRARRLWKRVRRRLASRARPRAGARP
jgi:glycosyltransferase involved in cell wall biosynthesis